MQEGSQRLRLRWEAREDLDYAGSHSLRGNCVMLDDYYLVLPAVEREMPRSVGLERVRKLGLFASRSER